MPISYINAPKAQEEAARKEAEEKAKAEKKDEGEEEEISDMAVYKLQPERLIPSHTCFMIVVRWLLSYMDAILRSDLPPLSLVTHPKNVGLGS